MSNELRLLIISVALCGIAGTLLGVGEQFGLWILEIMGLLLVWIAGFISSQSRVNKLQQEVIDLKVELLHK